MDNIQIGPIRYSVTKDDMREDGVIKYGECRIIVNERLSPQATRQTIWHEVVHGILTHGGFSRHDDRMIDVLAYGILQVLKDNPELRTPDHAPEG